MATYSLSIILFAFYTLVGAGLLSWLTMHERHPLPLQVQWLAPALGMAITALCVSLPNYYGLPVQAIAPWVTILLGLGGLLGVGLRRPAKPKTKHWLALGLVACGYLFAYWPAWLWDLNWVAFFNGDMAHFCAVAGRFIDGPFWAQPSLHALSGFDLAMQKTFHHTMGNDRFASEELLAYVSVLSGHKPISIYMSVQLAAYGTQLMAVMALVASKDHYHRRAYLAGLILSISSLSLFSLYSQLLPQCGGLALMMTVYALLTMEPTDLGINKLAVLQAVSISGLSILYPEVSPYAIIAYGWHLLYRWLKQKQRPLDLLKPVARATPIVVVLLNKSLLLMIVFMLFSRLPNGLSTNHEVIFPFFLLPSGLSIFAGFQPLSVQLAAPLQNFAIAAAFCLLLAFTLALLIRAARTGEPAILLCATMFLAGVVFTLRDNDFGSFKSALYIQPALAAGLAVLICSAQHRITKAVYFSSLIIVLLFNIKQSLYYAKASLNETSVAYGDMRELSRYGPLLPKIPPKKPLYVDSPSVVYEDALFTQLKGHYTYNANRAYLNNRILPAPHSKIAQSVLRWLAPSSDYFSIAQQHIHQLNQSTPISYNILGAKFTLTRNPSIEHFNDFLVITPRPEIRQFNHLHKGPAAAHSSFSVIPYAELHNYLVFIHSNRGAMYYTGHRFDAACYQPEKDLYFPGSFFRFGPYLLFEVINPTPDARLRISLTRSINAVDSKSLTRLLTIRGETEEVPYTCGYGSLNIISPPIQAIKINGQYFIAIESNAPTFQFPDNKHGLMNFYHHNIKMDYAASVGYMRDISVISNNQYLNINRPSSIAEFPSDLSNPALEYSGIYEDGWISPEAFLKLNRPPGGHLLSIKLQIPPQVTANKNAQQITIQLNDTPAVTRKLTAGINQIDLPLPPSNSDTLICKLAFTRSYRLTAPDSRPIAGKILHINAQ